MEKETPSECLLTEKNAGMVITQRHCTIPKPAAHSFVTLL
jgi:hypothetical protein